MYVFGLRVSGLGLKVWGSQPRCCSFQGSGRRVSLGSRASDLGFRVQGLGFRDGIQGLGAALWGLACFDWGLCRALDF